MSPREDRTSSIWVAPAPSAFLLARVLNTPTESRGDSDCGLHTRHMTAAAAGHRGSGSDPVSVVRPSVIDVASAVLAGLVGGVDGWKLQKLCYLVQGHHLAKTGLPAFREPIEAWTHGPVVDRLYQEHKRRRFVETLGGGRALPADDEAMGAVIADVVATFGRWSGAQLRELTRSQFPWIEARHGLAPMSREQRHIDPDTMREFFELMTALPDDDQEDGGAGAESWTGVLRF